MCFYIRKGSPMEQQIKPIQQLLLHSVRETTFYDQATDHIVIPELKSTFAKYLWLRSEHIVGIQSFLSRIDGRVPGTDSILVPGGRLWEFFKDAVKRRDNSAILLSGVRYANITLRKYASTMNLVHGKDHLHGMLHHHFAEIRDILNEFSSIKVNRSI